MKNKQKDKSNISTKEKRDRMMIKRLIDARSVMRDRVDILSRRRFFKKNKTDMAIYIGVIYLIDEILKKYKKTDTNILSWRRRAK